MSKATRHLVAWLLLLFAAGALQAQTLTDDTTGTTIIADPRLETLVNRHILLNQSVRTTAGFRIQIFSDSGVNSKNKAQQSLEDFRGRYPATAAYLTFKSPNYKVRVGDFRTRLEAQRFLADLSADYPNAFIISDPINLPQTDH